MTCIIMIHYGIVNISILNSLDNKQKEKIDNRQKRKSRPLFNIITPNLSNIRIHTSQKRSRQIEIIRRPALLSVTLLLKRKIKYKAEHDKYDIYMNLSISFPNVLFTRLLFTPVYDDILLLRYTFALNRYLCLWLMITCT